MVSGGGDDSKPAPIADPAERRPGAPESDLDLDSGAFDLPATGMAARGWLLTPLLVGVSAAVCILGYIQKLACRQAGFDLGQTFENACYTDIFPLFYGRGLADGKVPYIDAIPEPVEYPVVTGIFMHVMGSLARWLTPSVGDPAGTLGAGLRFYDLTVVALTGCVLVAVLATARVADRHALRTGLMFALAPGLLLAAFINWDLLAVMLVALSLFAWARRVPVVAGLLLGLAIGAKFYPVVLLGPVFLLCARAGRLGAFGKLLAATIGSWLAANGLVLLVATIRSWLAANGLLPPVPGDQWRIALEGLGRFYVFSQERPVDWGSIWYFAQLLELPFAGDAESLNGLGVGSFLVLCCGIAVLAWCAPRRPRLPQLLLLVLIAFMVTNKVWSPQYVLWLLPLVALARPKLPAYVAWQVAEVGYFLGIWFYLRALSLQQEMGPGLEDYPVPFLGTEVLVSADEIQNIYWVALLGRFCTVTLLAVLVIWEILRPGRDIVRADGADDPVGGVLDGMTDRFTIRGWLARRPGRGDGLPAPSSRRSVPPAPADTAAS